MRVGISNISRGLYILFFPILYLLSVLVYVVLYVRHFLYDIKIFKVHQFSNVYTICIGNLNFGGSGKTPFTNYLIQLLKPYFKIAVLSRGYGRHSRGFLFVQNTNDYHLYGDEPLMYKKQHSDVIVAVCENRVEGIQQILHHHPDVQVILLDDAFQHRSLRAHFNILLTEYSNLFFNDYLFPAGKLRDLKLRACYSDIIVVTKTPPHTEPHVLHSIEQYIDAHYHKEVFFSYIEYLDLYHIHQQQQRMSVHQLSQYNCILVTGIANPQPLYTYIKEYAQYCYHLVYPDHYAFSSQDIDLIKQMYQQWQEKHPLSIIVTTEKDATRLLSFIHPDMNLPIFVAPIQIQFHSSPFHQKILNYVRTNQRNS